MSESASVAAAPFREPAERIVEGEQGVAGAAPSAGPLADDARDVSCDRRAPDAARQKPHVVGVFVVRRRVERLVGRVLAETGEADAPAVLQLDQGAGLEVAEEVRLEIRGQRRIHETGQGESQIADLGCQRLLHRGQALVVEGNVMRRRGVRHRHGGD